MTMNFEYSNFIRDYYGYNTLITDTLCDEVRDAILGGSSYFLEKFEEKVHNIITGENKNGE